MLALRLLLAPRQQRCTLAWPWSAPSCASSASGRCPPSQRCTAASAASLIPLRTSNALQPPFPVLCRPSSARQKTAATATTTTVRLPSRRQPLVLAAHPALQSGRLCSWPAGPTQPPHSRCVHVLRCSHFPMSALRSSARPWLWLPAWQLRLLWRAAMLPLHLLPRLQLALQSSPALVRLLAMLQRPEWTLMPPQQLRLPSPVKRLHWPHEHPLRALQRPHHPRRRLSLCTR